MDDAIPLFFRIAGLVQVKENLESHGIYDFNFQAWKVKVMEKGKNIRNLKNNRPVGNRF